MPVLLKSGQSASREEAVEEIKDFLYLFIYDFCDKLHVRIDPPVSVEIQVSIDTVHPTSIDTVHQPSIDTVLQTSIDTVHQTSIDIVHQPSVDTAHQPSITTCLEAEKFEVLILKADENGMLRDKECRTRNSTGQLINAEGVVIPDVIDVAETNDFGLNREWYDWGNVFDQQQVSINYPIGISIDTPFTPSIDYPICISIDALLVKLYARVE
ncbi:hypothetical protein F2Q68_00010127 [Brassica cretica]|uniref:Uncharacterized protein n=2 Tax=Brassica cretica TaxID=69181 RepID=A0A8S9KZ01_BRACR|nr:hypothetical protein F2Q68_00010127 [Brassica cretica]